MSRIVSRLPRAGNDIPNGRALGLVTEHGAVNLKGKSEAERMQALDFYCCAAVS